MIIGGNSENSTRSRRNGTAVEEKGTASVTRVGMRDAWYTYVVMECTRHRWGAPLCPPPFGPKIRMPDSIDSIIRASRDLYEIIH